MAINVEITRNDGENNIAVLRRFRRRVQGAGVLPKVRSLRYSSRPLSDLAKKKRRLKSIERTKEREHLFKLGKISELKPTRRGRR